MDFSTVIKDRYSCKSYDGTAPSQEQIAAVLEASRFAPTAKNLQEHHIYVCQSSEALAKIDEITPCRYNAPCVLVVAFDTAHVFTYPGGTRDSGIEDASIVCTHLVLAAQNAGLQSCWVNLFDPEKVKRALNLPDGEEVLALVDLGFASEKGRPLPNHFNRKELAETVTYL
ncbi:MAG: nitroreductase family protein [Eggerthellaceae bacterium]|nr:nitroreductase family protein [Eggerthellaceae bacterium]